MIERYELVVQAAHVLSGGAAVSGEYVAVVFGGGGVCLSLLIFFIATSRFIEIPEGSVNGHMFAGGAALSMGGFILGDERMIGAGAGVMIGSGATMVPRMHE